MLSNYVWNLALSESLYPAVNALEIALRNAIHTSLTTEFGTDLWFDIPGLLIRWQPGEIANARNELTARNKPHTADRIVAELKCGFWTTLLSRDYHNSIWTRNHAAPLATAFPHLRGPGFRRDLVHAHFNELRIFRNRLFHFEPIYNHPDLHAKHDRIVEAIGWISPANVGLLAIADRFPMVHQRGLAEAWSLTTGYAATRLP